MVQRSTRRRNLKRGAGWGQGPPLSPAAYYVPEYKSTSNCYNMARPGAIQSNPDPAKAQTPMAGGLGRVAPRRRVSRSSSRRKTVRGGGGCGMKPYGGGRRRVTRRSMRGGGCGCMKMIGGGCGCMKMMGGRRATRRHRGGRFAVDVSQSIGGDGPNVAAMHSSIPCEAHRAMPLNPTEAGMLTSAPDLDVNVSGLRPGAAMFGGGAPAGEHPLAYTAPSAGFSFTPNIKQGLELNPGQIPYQEVVPQNSLCTSSTCDAAIAAINKQ